MTPAVLAGMVGAAVVGLGLYGLIVDPQPLRKLLAFNLIGSGVFLIFGIVARRGAAAGFEFDPVPQAMVITGIVVAFAASALAVALILRLSETSGRVTLDPDAWTKPDDKGDEGRRPMTASTTPGGFLLVLAILLPVGGVLLSFVLGGRFAERVALAVTPFGLALALAIAARVAHSGQPLVYAVGGHAPPLGIALRADGISAVMLVAAALIFAASGFYARAKFATPPGVAESRAPLTFWIMLQAIWAALTIVFVSGDLFNLYVALELLTFAAVPLVCIDGRPETLAAALRYLLFALFGSICYLLGAALFYGAYGTLDIALLAQRVQSTLPAVWAAAALMTAGLLAKTALVPAASVAAAGPRQCARRRQRRAVGPCRQRLVLPDPAAVVLCAAGAARPARSAPSLGALGSAAILFGSVLALRQARLKLLIAYSTIAQIGYLFLIFPLASGAHAWSADGWSGGMMQVLAHAFAKAAMFFAAGTAGGIARP